MNKYQIAWIREQMRVAIQEKRFADSALNDDDYQTAGEMQGAYYMRLGLVQDAVRLFKGMPVNRYVPDADEAAFLAAERGD